MPFGKVFPNLVTAASYDPFFLYVSLDSVSSAEFAAMDFTVINEQNYETIALIWHEFTHWIDHIGTLWGQKNLVLLLNALNARANNDPREFWRIKTHELSNHADDLANYYNTTHMDHVGGFRNLWRYQHTCGLRFDLNGVLDEGKPLLFTKFATAQGRLIARVPVSVVSVLETNATYAEFMIKSGYIAGIEDIVDRMEKQRALSRELESILYDSDLTLYSVVAHMTATPNHITDIFKAYDISSSVGTLLLNLPTNVLSAAPYLPNDNEEWNRRASAMIGNADIGFGFYNLMQNLINAYGPDNYSLANLLQASHLPEQEELERRVLTAMHFNLRELHPGPLSAFGTALINMGMQIFIRRGIDGKKIPFTALLDQFDFTPDVIFSDTPFNNQNIDMDDVQNRMAAAEAVSFDERIALFAFYEEKMNEFLKVCGV